MTDFIADEIVIITRKRNGNIVQDVAILVEDMGEPLDVAVNICANRVVIQPHQIAHTGCTLETCNAPAEQRTHSIIRCNRPIEAGCIYCAVAHQMDRIRTSSNSRFGVRTRAQAIRLLDSLLPELPF